MKEQPPRDYIRRNQDGTWSLTHTSPSAAADMAGSLREIADLIESGRAKVESGGMLLDKPDEAHISIQSNLVLVISAPTAN